MAVTRDLSDLVERAATELGALSSGQTLSEEDQESIEELVDPLVRQLSLDGVVDISDTDAIPSEYFLPLAKLLANVAAPSFGQQESRDVKMSQERALRSLAQTRPTFETMKTVYY